MSNTRQNNLTEQKLITSEISAMEKRTKETLSLPEALTHLLEECRMVLPGIQALFGFQLIVVFNSTFREALSSNEQILHLVAIGLVAIAVALVMTPATFHRQTSPYEATQNLIEISTRLLLFSMFPLMLGICLDFYLIARLVLNNRLVSMALSLILLILFSTFWFLFPRLPSLQRVVRGRK